MDFWATVLVLLRRWYITVPAFLASLGLAAMAYSAVPAVYESSSVLVLTTPLGGSTEGADGKHPSSLTNPMLNFDRSLSLAAAIVIQQMNNSETAAALGVPPGSTVSYEVTNGSTNPELLESGPFLFIRGTGPTAEAAQEITDDVAARAVEVLAQRQQALKAPASTRISTHVVVPRTPGQLLSGNPARAAAAALGLAGFASLAAVYGFESLMTHRKRRKDRALRERALLPTADDAAAAGALSSEALLWSPAAAAVGTARLVHQAPASVRKGNHRPKSGAPVPARDVLESRADLNLSINNDWRRGQRRHATTQEMTEGW